MYAEPSTTGPQWELNVTVISIIIKRSCCWVQAVYLASFCGRLVSQCCGCSCLHSPCLPPEQPSQKAWENMQSELQRKHKDGLEPALNKFIRALQDFSRVGGHHHPPSPKVFVHSRYQQTTCFWIQGSYPRVTNRIHCSLLLLRIQVR